MYFYKKKYKSFTHSPTQKIPIFKQKLSSYLFLLGSSLFLSTYAQAYNTLTTLDINPSTHDFESISVDTSSSATFTLTATDTSIKMIDALASITTTTDEFGHVSTAYSNEFSVRDDRCSNQVVNTSCEFSILFTPTSSGKKELLLSIPHNKNTEESISITTILLKGEGIGSTTSSGEGVVSEVIEFSPKALNFSDVNVNGFSSSQATTIENIGRSNIFIGNVNIENTNDFALTDNCSGKTIEPNQSCSIKSIFTPKTKGIKETQLSFSVFDNLSASVEGNLSLTNKAVTLTGNGITAVPDIALSLNSFDFGDVYINTGSEWQAVSIKNQGKNNLLLGDITVSGDSSDFEILNYCSHRTVPIGNSCNVSVKFKTPTEGIKTLTLSIPSNDPDTPTAEAVLTGNGFGWCQGDYSKEFTVYPENNNFGIDLIDTEHELNFSISSKIKGCEGVFIEAFSIIGTHADEFSVKKQSCYEDRGWYYNSSYSHCRFKTTFSPKLAGDKTASIQVVFSDKSIHTIPITAKAVERGTAKLSASLNSHDFGSITIEDGIWEIHDNTQSFLIENTGDINIKVTDIMTTGHASDFLNARESWCIYGYLAPTEQCEIEVTFVPTDFGLREAVVTIQSTAPDTNIALSGTGLKNTACNEEAITIESTQSGAWANRSADGLYDVPSKAWKRLKHFKIGEKTSTNTPNFYDVVRINAGHTITGIPETRVHTLCITKNATLHSMKRHNLFIDAHHISNKGTIQGHNGSLESSTATCDEQRWWENIEDHCAQPGSSIILSTYTINNEGNIYSGHGGDGKQYAAPGGDISLLGRAVINKGNLIAGNGGKLTGTLAGRAGDGGIINAWAEASITNTGQNVIGGNGGNCNNITTQEGGNGGDISFNAGRTLNLLDGNFTTGAGGVNCGTNGINGGSTGFLLIEPPLLNIAGANVKINAGDVEIYGGESWQLNLTDMDNTIEATGDITIAVGTGGTLDFTGTSSTAFKAGGQVNIFADYIILDDGVTLEDIIDAENIVVGSGKLLRNIVITAPNKLLGEPGDVLPVTVTLSNASGAEDTVTLTIVDSSGWTISPVSSPATVNANGTISVPIPALQSVEVQFTVTLAPNVGDSNVVTVTATSQANAEAAGASNIRFNVVAAEDLAMVPVVTSNNVPTPSNTSGSCPTTGKIKGMCQNDGYTIKDATIEGSISGGFLEGTITVADTALISRVTVKRGAVTEGGEFTGSVINNGEMNNFSFVGNVLENGTLGGKITGSKKIRSTIKNVQLSANTSIENQELEGTIIGDYQAPAVLKNIVIKDNTMLQGVVIGANVKIGNNVTFGKGVRFTDTDDIPSNVSLANLLPTLAVSTNKGISDSVPLDLSADILSEGKGLLADINAVVAEQGWELVQNTQHGYLQLDDGDFRYTIRTSDVRKTMNPSSFHMSANQKIHFYTGTQLEVVNQPVVQDINALHTALVTMGLPTLEVKKEGTLKIMNTDGSWYSVRPNIFSERVGSDKTEGVSIEETVRFTFIDEKGDKRQQLFYAAPADMAALLAIDNNLSLDNHNILQVKINGKNYQGRLDYRVTQGTAPSNGEMQVIHLTNGVKLIYPNGERQILYSN